MTEFRLTMVPVEVDGYCDPESGVCAVPESSLATGADAVAEPTSDADADSTPTAAAPATE